MEGQVQQVVTPRAQAVHGVVEAEGEGAEGPEGLVAAAVRQQGAPEVVIQDVGPRRLREKVLVALDGATAKHRTIIRHSQPGGPSPPGWRRLS